jgi:hypothetical protein
MRFIGGSATKPRAMVFSLALEIKRDSVDFAQCSALMLSAIAQRHLRRFGFILVNRTSKI